MKFSNFKYLVKQGFLNFRENKLMSLASVGVVCSCLIIVGICALLAVNINSLVSYLGDQNEVIVYILEDAEQSQIDEIDAFIKNNDNISSYKFVSKDAALAEQIEYLGEYGDLLSTYQGENNPLPASFRCHIKNLEALQQTSSDLSMLAGVDMLTTPTELVGVLITIKNGAYYGGLGVLAILVFVSIVVISNTIRLTVFARRKEINIMKFVGATNSFIRLPFVVEGIIIGTVSALITFFIISGGYYYMMYYLAQNATGWLATISANFIPYSEIWVIMLPTFLVFGWFIGSVGSAISMKKHLRV